MATLIMNVYKGQRMDITAQMRDADTILDIFRNHNIRFDKKYTSLNNDGPSTITFKGLKAKEHHSDLTRMVVDLDKLAQENTIGNVYVKFTSFMKPPVKSDIVKADPAPEEMVISVDDAVQCAINDQAENSTSAADPLNNVPDEDIPQHSGRYPWGVKAEENTPDDESAEAESDTL